MAYVRGLGWRRSGLNDVSADVVAAFSPPPTDIVLRVRVFGAEAWTPWSA